MNQHRPERKPHAASIAVLAVLAACLFAVPLTAIAAERYDVETVGVPQIGARGITRSTMDIMFQQSIENSASSGPVRLMNEHEGPERDELPLNPASPLVASVPNMPVDRMVYTPTQKGIPMHEFSPQTIGTNFTAATLSGTNPTSSFPPDCNGAIGPTQFIVAVNGRIVTFNKTTGVADAVLNASTDAFFTSVRAASGTSDPMIRYDRLSGRWFITIINVSTPNRWLLAVSDAASNGVISAGTVWTFFFFIPPTTAPTIANGSTCLADYPSLGIDANALYTGVNEFCGASQAYQQSDGFVIRKSSVLGAGPIVVTAFRSLSTTAAGMWSPRGVDNFDPAATEGYIFGTDFAAFGVLNMFRVANPGGTPTISSIIPITVPATSQAINVPHLGNANGTNGFLDPLDDRPFEVVMRNQHIYTTHNIAVDNTGVAAGTLTRDAARWYEFNVPVGAGTPTIVQSGTVFTANASNVTTDRHYWMPSVMVSGQGHMAMSLSASATTENVNAATVGRLATDPLGTMQTPVLTTASSSSYNPSSDPGSATRPRRWGDYSAVTLDPIDDMTMWSVAEFVDATNSYGVRVTKLIAPAPATPSVLADVVTGQAATPVTLTGVSVAGTGFYDPGANLPGVQPFSHLSATITNGAASGTPPTVVSATYVNPTTINLVLNTTSATANLTGQKYTLNITNPDGQTSSAAVVKVNLNGFTISASAGAGGTISPSGAVLVTPGGNQTFAITPGACFNIGDVLVDGASVGAVATYTFTNVTATHTISASFAIKTFTVSTSVTGPGTITPGGAVSVNCGSNQAFSISPNACSSTTDVVVDGSSVGVVTSYTFSNVTANHTIAATFITGLSQAASALTTSQIKLGNDVDGTTKINVNFTLPMGAVTAEVWRKGFGSYPTYDNGGGSVPVAPGSYPPAGWTQTLVSSSGGLDEPSTRDAWYYVVYAKDACSNVGPVSAVAGGTLDYHLGDVSDGVTAGQGDNTVGTPDISLLGAHYGIAGAGLAGFEYLDVGPTTTLTTNGRPTTDQVIDFEDLVMFAVNYTPNVSLVAGNRVPSLSKAPVAVSQGIDALRLEAPEAVIVGDVFDVPVVLNGSGRMQALSVALRWNAAVVRPVGVSPGELVNAEGGVVFSPGPGRADAALLGAGAGMSGEGVVATVKFRAVGAGAPNVSIGHAIGRSTDNKDIAVTVQSNVSLANVASSTELYPVIPNPARGSAMIQYALAKAGAVNLAVYSVDGRRVKLLVSGTHDAGRFQVNWNGADDRGTPMTSGMYFVRFEAGGNRTSRVLTVIR